MRVLGYLSIFLVTLSVMVLALPQVGDLVKYHVKDRDRPLEGVFLGPSATGNKFVITNYPPEQKLSVKDIRTCHVVDPEWDKIIVLSKSHSTVKECEMYLEAAAKSISFSWVKLQQVADLPPRKPRRPRIVPSPSQQQNQSPQGHGHSTTARRRPSQSHLAAPYPPPQQNQSPQGGQSTTAARRRPIRNPSGQPGPHQTPTTARPITNPSQSHPGGPYPLGQQNPSPSHSPQIQPHQNPHHDQHSTPATNTHTPLNQDGGPHPGDRDWLGFANFLNSARYRPGL